MENRLLDDMNKVMIITGYRYYVLLRTISDFETEPNSGLDKLFDSNEPAIKFYSQGTCCLEISKERLNDTPEILRVYFQVYVPQNRWPQKTPNQKPKCKFLETGFWF